jgi:diguanylate cyclase (GGDEF)-like protein/PAS domain S-box-containing protein
MFGTPHPGSLTYSGSMAMMREVLHWASTAGFCLVALITAASWIRDRGRQRRYIALTTGLFGLSSILGLATPFLPSWLTLPVGLVSLASFMGAGYALFLFRDSLVPLRRRTKITVGVANLVVTILTGTVSVVDPSPNTLLLVAAVTAIGVWMLTVAEPVMRLWLLSRGRPAVQRARLRSLSAGFAGIVLLLLVALVALPLAENALFQVGLQGLGLVTVPILVAAFAPPSWLRAIWRRREASAAAESMRQLLLFSPDRRTLAERSLDGAMRMVGADAGLVADFGLEPLYVEGLNDELTGRLVAELKTGTGRVLDLPDDRSALIVPWDAPQGRAGLVLASGPFTPVFGADELTMLERYGAAIAAAFDRERLVESLRETKERFQRVFTEGSVGMAVVGPDYMFMEVNAALCQMLGYEHDELMRLGVKAVTHPDDYEHGAEQSREMFAGRGGSYKLEKRYLKKTGEEVWVNVSVSVVRDENGKPVYSIGIIQDVTERRRAERELQFLALHDTLTELPNRTLFTDRLEQAIIAARRDGSSFGLMVMDMDGFKDVNDSLGHPSGDHLLRQMAVRLKGALRGTDTVARLGGDEFGVLPLSTSTVDATTVAARKILGALQVPFEIGEAKIDAGLSIGIVQFPEHGRDAETLLRRADVAMYVAKRNRTGIAVYSTEQDEHSAGRLALMTELRQAIRNHQLTLHYMPKVDVRSRRTYGVEALVRWIHPVRGMIPPDQFIPLAEQTDLMSSLARWVLEEALDQLVRWRAMGLELSMAVNLSAANLHEASLPDVLGAMLKVRNLDPAVLTVEITESAIMGVPAEKTVRLLSQMGVGVSIDDFGTGYASLSYLRTLPVDEIKIDRSFVQHMAQEPDDAGIVQPTVDLGHNLRLRVTAEGVEDEQTWMMLESMGCDSAQGYYISQGRPADEITMWLRASAWGLGGSADAGPDVQHQAEVWVR